MLRKRDELTARFLSFQTKYRELREHFLTLRQHFYPIECVWCQQRISWKHKTAAVPDETSHNICPRCAAEIVRKNSHADGLSDAGGLRRDIVGRASGGS